MEVRNKASKFYYVYFLLITILLLILFYPRRIENGVFIKNAGNKSFFYIEGSMRRFKTTALGLERYSVVDFKFNLFRAYSFKKVKAINERIMIKKDTEYDLELSGYQRLSKKSYYYMVDNNGAISPSQSSNIIVGKNNVVSYRNKEGLLNTFIIYPLDYSTIRVALSNTGEGSSPIYHEKIEITAQSPLNIYSKIENYSTKVSEKTVITLEYFNGEIKLSMNNLLKNFSKRIYVEGSNMMVSSIKRGENKSVTPVYGGIIEISPSPQGLLMINEVNIEEYLTKVVPSEMPSSSNIEALKCQAIAARTYAISDMLSNRYANIGFHVDDTTRSQVYNNIIEQPSTTEAVKATEGLIMSYKNDPIDAKYYSTSCGTGVSYNDVWLGDGGNDYKPYLRTNNYLEKQESLPSSEEKWLEFFKDNTIPSVDSGSPYYRWKIVYPIEALTKTLNKSIKELWQNETKSKYVTVKQNGEIVKELPEFKNLKDIKILNRSERGLITKISYVFENAEVELLSESCVRYSIKCSEDYAGEPIPVIKNNGRSSTNIGSLYSAFFSVEKRNNNIVIYGGGFGHGAGMSQYGAMEMAKKGSDYLTILNTFYKGIKITSIY